MRKRKKKKLKPVFDWDSKKVTNERTIVDPRTGSPVIVRELIDKNGLEMGEIEMNFTLFAKPIT